MNYKDYFVSYALNLNRFLADFFQEKISTSSQITEVAPTSWENLQKFIVGGKRIRGGLVKLGYECLKKGQEKEILPVSAAIEITHGAILVHDDIIDRSAFRHGQPTVHRRYEAIHSQNYHKGEPRHYGESMAIMVGDIGFYQAIILIAGSQFPDKFKLKAIDYLSSFMIETAYGEELDVDLGCREMVKEKEVLTIHALKTAQYTIVGPLKLGGILAGGMPKQLSRLAAYGLPLGIAFQLQDDILGLFGDEKELGKPVGDDIAEGKNTLLLTQALKKGNEKQRRKLLGLWGKPRVTLKEIAEVREIMKETGALAYSQEMANNLVKQGKKIVPAITQDKKLQEVFLSLADFIVERQY